MIPNDVNITRLALRQSHTAADGLLLAAQTELKLPIVRARPMPRASTASKTSSTPSRTMPTMRGRTGCPRPPIPAPGRRPAATTPTAAAAVATWSTRRP